MKPRKMRPKIIPSQDPDRAYRFYRDVFEFLRDPKDQTTLIVDKKAIKFKKSNQKQQIELIVRDHLSELRQHLANNFIEEIEPVQKAFNNKAVLKIKDSEGNTVQIECNQDK